MTPAELIEDLHRLGVALWADGDRLRYRAPKEVMTPVMRRLMSEHKQEILVHLRQANALPSLTSLPFKPISRDGELPLSFSQERLWFLDQLEPNSPAYNIPLALRITGPLNIGALEQSINKIVGRHDVLRTICSTVSGKLTQVIAPDQTQTLPVVDLRQLPKGEREAEMLRLAVQEAREPFDLARGPLLRALLLRLAPEENVLLLLTHHFVADGWSMEILYKEISIFYEAYSTGKPSPLSALAIQYADFVHWQRETVREELLEAQRSYWKKQLAGIPPMLELPTDRPRPAIQTYKGASQYFELPKDLSEAIRTLSRQEGITLFMTLLAAFQTLLHRYTHQDDIVVATAVSNRSRIETEVLIGSFANTLILRTDVSGDPSFRTLLERVREVAVNAYVHQELPFEKLVEELQPERDLSRNPLFQVMFVLHQHTPEQDLKLPGLTLSRLPIETGTAKFDLSLDIADAEGILSGTLIYSTDLFDASTITRMVRHYQKVLEGIAADPEQRLSDLPLIAEAERHQIVVVWNDTKTDYPTDSCIHQLFEAQVERTPDSMAVVCKDEHITYQQLNERANAFAHDLAMRGIGRGSYVPVLMDRGVEVVVSFLAIMKAGAAFVPLDTLWPEDRLKHVLEELNSEIILVNQATLSRISNENRSFLLIDEQGSNPATSNMGLRVHSDDPIYAIYTSGSTGKPKAAVVPHRGIANRFLWMNDFFGCDAASVTLQTTRHVHDSSVWQLFWPLINGGKTVIPPSDMDITTEAITTLIAEHGITIIDFVPSLLDRIVPPLIADSDMEQKLETLRAVIVGGEEMSPATTHLFVERFPKVRLINLYGPTEASIGCIRYEVTGQENGKIPIGVPIANVQALILDQHKNPVPVGIPGEIFLAGACVGLGYLNDEPRTRASFIHNPFQEIDSDTLYRTGDLARYLPDGNIEFLGRIDHQVKIRGFRIEPGEVESALRQHPAVREAVVVAREYVSGDRRLVAYVVPEEENAQVLGELRNFAKGKLPDYMVPSAIVPVKALPLTPNGKVDRQALPIPDMSQWSAAAERSYVAPRDELESRLTQIWEQVLDVRPVSVKDNFFDLGGHSLLAVRLFDRIQQTLGEHLPLTTLFQHATVEALASVIRTEQHKTPQSNLIQVQAGDDRKPLFCVAPVNNDALGFAMLARAMGSEQPFYGLQFPHPSELPAVVSIESIATQSIREIRSLQPNGPYLLGGACLGGFVAFEMARQLRRDGHDVPMLFILDASQPPPLITLRHYISRLLLYHLPRGEMFFCLWRDMHEKIRKHSRKLSLSRKSRHSYAVWRAYEVARKTYRPRPYPGRLTIFQSREFHIRFPEYVARWSALAREGVDHHVIPSGHGGTLHEPHVQDIAGKLRTCLARLHRQHI